MGLGGLDGRGDGGEGEGLEGGSWNRGMIGGGVGDRRVTPGSVDGTGGGTQVDLVESARCEAEVRGAVSR
jgi:hypothetical protein